MYFIDPKRISIYIPRAYSQVLIDIKQIAHEAKHPCKFRFYIDDTRSLSISPLGGNSGASAATNPL